MITWDTKVLYKSLNDEQFLSDIKLLKEQFNLVRAKLMTSPKKADDMNCLAYFEDLFLLFQEVIGRNNNVSTYVLLKRLENVNDTEAEKYLEKTQEFQSEIEQCTGLLKQKLGQLDGTEELQDSGLAIYQYFINEAKHCTEHELSAEEAKIIYMMQLTGGVAWRNYHDRLDGNAKAVIMEHEMPTMLPLAVVRNMAFASDSKIRKNAYKAELKAYTSYDEAMAECLNGIKGEAINMASFKKYDSVLDWMLSISRMSRGTLDAMMQAVERKLPAFRRYLKAKAKLLGHNRGLPFYDLFAPVRKSRQDYSYEEARKYLVNVFKDFDNDMGDFIDTAFENKWIDPFPREGKQGGALCAELFTKDQSRIFCNFTGSFMDVVTIAHELGHAYHGRSLKDLPYLLRDAPTPLCETASVFNEQVVYAHALEHAKEEEKLSLLDCVLTDAVKNVVDIYSRYLFETEVIERRKEGIMTVQEIKDAMLRAQKTAYGDGLDEKYMHPYMWMCKPHYYIPNYHFYNFPYTFGLLFSVGIYQLYRMKEEGFLQKYQKLLFETCTGSVEQAGESIGIDLTKGEFWDQSLMLFDEYIEEFEHLSEAFL